MTEQVLQTMMANIEKLVREVNSCPGVSRVVLLVNRWSTTKVKSMWF